MDFARIQKNCIDRWVMNLIAGVPVLDTETLLYQGLGIAKGDDGQYLGITLDHLIENKCKH